MPILPEIKTPIGWMRVHATSMGATKLDWQMTPFDNLIDLEDINALNVSRETSSQLNAYLGGQLRQFTVPFDLSNETPSFQAWLKALTRIPYGEIISYADLAEIWGNRRAARPAGQACRRNPLAILIPCHRVNNASGKVHRYGGGNWSSPADNANLDRKIWLQNLEQQNRS